MNKATACLVAALLVMYMVSSDAHALPAREGGVGAGRRLLDTGTDGSGEAAPSGSYKESCKNIQFTDDNGGTVIANCGDGAGGNPRSEIKNVASCSKGIYNDGGVLKC
ncbi:hypothetical protein ABBQ32_007916 [Trebouxia sp. C0010 RCD-2024]